MSDEKKSWLREARDKIEGKVEAQKSQLEAGKAQAGNLVIEKKFGGHDVSIFDGGFIRIGSGFLSPYEKLKSIQYRQQTRDKSTSEMVGTFGLASKERIECSLAIVTDRKVRTLKGTVGFLQPDDKNGMALEAAGQAVLDSLRSSGAEASTQGPVSDPADQLKKLAELLDAGILTDEEFKAKKAELLKRM